MRKTKQTIDYERINTFKERYEHLTTEKIIERLTSFKLTKEASVAYRQVLKDRGIDDYLSDTKLNNYEN